MITVIKAATDEQLDMLKDVAIIASEIGSVPVTNGSCYIASTKVANDIATFIVEDGLSGADVLTYVKEHPGVGISFRDMLVRLGKFPSTSGTSSDDVKQIGRRVGSLTSQENLPIGVGDDVTSADGKVTSEEDDKKKEEDDNVTLMSASDWATKKKERILACLAENRRRIS